MPPRLLWSVSSGVYSVSVWYAGRDRSAHWSATIREEPGTAAPFILTTSDRDRASRHLTVESAKIVARARMSRWWKAQTGSSAR